MRVASFSRNANRSVIVLAIVVPFLLQSCGGGSAQVPPTAPPPAVSQAPPNISSVTPTSATAGTTILTVKVFGSGFTGSSVVRWDSTNLTTTLVSATELDATLTASQLGAAGNAQIQVFNSVGAMLSNSVPFTVQNPVPAIQSISPSSAAAGAANVVLTITGSGFVAGSSLQWNGRPLSYTFVSATTLQVALTLNELAVVGNYPMQISNTGPGGGSSNTFSFDVQNGVPILLASTQTSASAGGAGFSMIIDGSYFVAGSTVLWDGSPLQTTFQSGSQLIAEVTADKISQAGSRQLTVWNPQPAGGFSNGLSFLVNPVTNTFIYVAQPADGLIARMVVDPVSKNLRPDGFDSVTRPGAGLWAMQLHRSRKFLYTLDFSSNQILGFSVNAKNGALTPIAGATAATGSEPTYIASHSSGKFIYVTNLQSGDISGYAVDPGTGALQPLSGSPFSAGTYPLGIVTDDSGRFVFVTNYGSSTISVYSVAANGNLVPVPGSPFATVGSGPWTPALDPLGRFLFVPNYDSADVSVYAVNPLSGSLTPVTGSPFKIGTFPSYLTIDPAGRFLYVSDSNDNITGLVHILAVGPATGQLTPIASSPITVGTSPNRMSFGNSGARAFLTNYASWDLMAFDVNPQDGSLTLTEALATRNDPDSMVIMEGGTQYTATPQVAYVAQTAAGSISLYHVDASTGLLSSSQSLNSPAPSALALDPGSKFLFSLNAPAGQVSPLQIDAATGALSPSIAGPFNVGTDPQTVVLEPTRRFAYVLNKAVGEISQYAVDPSTGALTLQSTLAVGTAPSALAAEPTGRYIYVAFPGSAVLKVYVINSSGALSLQSTVAVGAQGPSQLAADPYGRFVAITIPANGEVRLYSIYAATGDLNAVSLVFPGLQPSAIAFDPSGRFLVVTDAASSTVSSYQITGNGQMQKITTVPTGNLPTIITMDPSNSFVYVGNSGSADICIYRLNPQTGALQIANAMVLSAAPSAIAIRRVP